VETELLGLVPEIHRARSWRLYAGNGKRLVDLWQYGGRAILGHTPPGLLRSFKNSAGRGLFVPVPHYAQGRLLKALALMVPGVVCRIYADEAALRDALAAAGFPAALPFADPAMLEPGDSAGGSSLWRPFLDVRPAPLVPVLPLPFPGGPAVLAFDPGLEETFPPSQILSPVLLAAAARSIYDLAAAKDRGTFRFAKIERALKQKTVWRRRAIYLRYEPDAVDPPPPGPAVDAAYAALFRRFLDGGFLLPPNRRLPAILPGELSPGEEAKLAGLLTG
jgi:hypothetical protein